MFFRVKTSPSRKVLQLIESYRTEEGAARQQVVVSLGNAAIEKQLQRGISKAVEQRLYDDEVLLEPDLNDTQRQWADEIVNRVEREGKWTPRRRQRRSENRRPKQKARENVVDGVLIDEVSHTHSTTLGPALVGLHAWGQLDIDQRLSSLGFNVAQRDTAAASVINRRPRRRVAVQTPGRTVLAFVVPERGRSLICRHL